MPTNDPFLASLRKWVEVFMRRSMHNFISYSKERDLSLSQIGALFHIFHGKCSVSDISDYLGVTNAASSQMIERLVQQDLILRKEDPYDRRVKQLALTEAGRKVIQESIAARQDWLESLSQSLTESEREQVIAALDLLTEKASQLDHASEPALFS